MPIQSITRTIITLIAVILLTPANAAYADDAATNLAAAKAAIESGDLEEAFAQLDGLLGVDMREIDNVTFSVLYARAYMLTDGAEFAIDFYNDAMVRASASDIVNTAEFQEILDGISRFLMQEDEIEMLSKVADSADQVGIYFENVMIEPDGLDLILSDPFVIVPSEVADFVRAETHFFQLGWQDLSFRYYVGPENERFVDIYLSKYGAESAADHFTLAKDSIRSYYDSAEILSEDLTFNTLDAEVPDGRYAIFRSELGDLVEASELLLIVVDDWHLKLRANYPWDNREGSQAQVAAFIDQFPWPVPAIIPLPISVTDGTVCPSGVPAAGASTPVTSAAAALGMGLTYVTYSRGTTLIPIINRDEFCVAGKFRSYGQNVTTYARFKEEAEVEPSDEYTGPPGTILYHFSVNNDQEFMEVSTSLLLEELIANDPDQEITRQAIQITYYGQFTLHLMGLFDGVPTEETLARFVSEMIAGQFDPLVSVNIAAANAS